MRTKLIGTLAVGAAALASVASAASPSLSATASRLADRSVDVSCIHFSDPGTAGDANYATGKVRLALDVCRALRAPRVVVDPPYPLANTGFAVVTLGHEAAHMRGMRDEEKADRFGWRNVRRTALMLGYTQSQLPLIVSQAKETTYGT